MAAIPIGWPAATTGATVRPATTGETWWVDVRVAGSPWVVERFRCETALDAAACAAWAAETTAEGFRAPAWRRCSWRWSDAEV